MTQQSRLLYAVIFLVSAAGFLVPFWPLSIVGILMAALSGRFIFAVILGLLLDIAWGAPMGLFKYAFFPFTIVALVGVLARSLGGKYFLDRNPQERV